MGKLDGRRERRHIHGCYAVYPQLHVGVELEDEDRIHVQHGEGRDLAARGNPERALPGREPWRAQALIRVQERLQSGNRASLDVGAVLSDEGEAEHRFRRGQPDARIHPDPARQSRDVGESNGEQRTLELEDDKHHGEGAVFSQSAHTIASRVCLASLKASVVTAALVTVAKYLQHPSPALRAAVLLARLLSVYAR